MRRSPAVLRRRLSTTAPITTTTTTTTTSSFNISSSSNSSTTRPDRLTLSSVSGPHTPPLVSKTLPAFFREDVLARHGARPALVAPHERARPFGGPGESGDGQRHLVWDFAALDAHVQALARGLVALGVRKGDRVGVIMGNNSAYACLQWACASVGAILVTLNPAYRLPELVNTLNLVGVSHLFLVPRLRSSAYVRTLADAFPGLARAAPGEIAERALPALRHLVVVDNTAGGAGEYARETADVRPAVDFREVFVWREDGAERGRVAEMGAGLSADEVINLQFTSGTTGAPKAVSLTHHNLLNNGLSIGRCMRFTPSDVLCNVPPLFHCFDKCTVPASVLPTTRLVIGNLAAWLHGACVVYPSELYSPPAIVDALVRERCTALHGVPTHFLGVLAEVARRREEGQAVDLRTLRTGTAAGSPIPIDLMKQLIEKMNLTELTVAYGMSAPVSFQTTPDDAVLKRVETTGKVLPHVKAKIVNAEGEVVPVNTPGEVLVSGYVLQKGYWDDPEQTAQAMQADGEGTVWMRTGDEGMMDEEGYLRIVGRIKDIVIRGGENLFPVQIENVLTAHPHIREAAVVSVPDAKYGEVVGAWIVREPQTTGISREEVRRVVAEGMNPQNAPGWVWFVGEDGVAEEVPKTASGKVQKHVLRRWAKDLAHKGVGRVR
ncbi:acyl-CoA synthetase [Trametes gibbosa]|nr:acyl-CoA synthetase [Trametes gibbosa]